MQGAIPRETDLEQPLCAGISGVSLHAAVRCAADDGQARAAVPLVTRTGLANERVQTNAASQVVLKLKSAWRDGTTHLVASRLEFVQLHNDRQLCGIEFS